ncbi:MAG: NAD(P)-dependent oxidoreductase [Muribaculaceae bacterium]|nr:NAD(P)-dependent oxidoreductase [Muribaculaceae bacterium]
MKKKILIVGAGGFIGGYIAREALNRGYETWVGVRESTSRRYLTDERLHFLVLNYDSAEEMEAAIGESMPGGDRWDAVIYNLGATKAVNFMDFNRVNFTYLRTFVETLKKMGKVPERFLYMSSLSALGPYDEKNYTPIPSDARPDPDTRYGLSKIKAESYLRDMSGVPYIIFRPTGVYGPHEKDYLLMIECIDKHWDFSVGLRKQLLTFIYVEDLVNAMFDALQAGVVNKTYNIAEGRAYTQAEFRSIVAEELGKKWVIPVKLPLWAVWTASAVAEKMAAAKMQASTLNRDKYKIMRQRNWDCDISAAQKDFGFNPKFNLRDGLRETIKAYREMNREGGK